MTAQHPTALVHASGLRRASLLHTALAGALAASTLLAAGGAQAAVAAGITDTNSDMFDITYGNAGNIFELLPRLSVTGLSPTGNAQDVAGKSGGVLQYAASVSSPNSALMTVEYLLHNTSPSDSFTQLRFMVYADPNGAPDLSDRLSQTWGDAVAGDPVLREGRAFQSLGIVNNFGFNNNLSEGTPPLGQPLDATCTTPAGCQATVALQWNAPVLAPGETFRIRLGLSDNGQSVSGRFLSIAAVNDPATVLTFSGQSEILPVPEPGAAWMLAAGLAGLGFMARRRQAG